VSLENGGRIRNLAAGAQPLEIFESRHVERPGETQDEGLAVGLLSLELDVTEGASRAEQEISHPGIVRDIRTFTIQDYRVMVDRFRSLVLQGM
jgi:hypothetical protein